MTDHTYAGHTLAEIKAAAEKANARCSYVQLHAASVLAMAARIDDLEKQNAQLLNTLQIAYDDMVQSWHCIMNEYGTGKEVLDDEIASGREPALAKVQAAIRAMQPPAEWQCAEAVLVCGAAPNVEWKHEDGFGGGLTERNHDGQD